MIDVNISMQEMSFHALREISQYIQEHSCSYGNNRDFMHQHVTRKKSHSQINNALFLNHDCHIYCSAPQENSPMFLIADLPQQEPPGINYYEIQG